MKIVCFGDSNTWGYDPRGYFGGRYDAPWPELLAGKLHGTVHNQGENGREIPTEPVAFPDDMELLIIMLGTNDLLQGLSAEAVGARMVRFLESLDCRRILLIAPPPMRPGAWATGPALMDASLALANQYRTVSRQLGTAFADAGQWNLPMAYDGVHLTEEGHRVFAEELFSIISDVTGG